MSDGHPNLKKVSNRQLNYSPIPFSGISLNIGVNSLYRQEGRQLICRLRYNPPQLYSLQVEKPPLGTLFIEVKLYATSNTFPTIVSALNMILHW